MGHLGNDFQCFGFNFSCTIQFNICAKKNLVSFCVGVNQSRGYATREVVSSWFIYYLAILRSVGVLIFF